ncbi:MAG: hypothetical protein O9282_14035 [Flavobacterium sp.]|jgi:hypothetical protein|uniref:hypothetical protein n=1 Tax=Flavobacterium sp. TaxID=239 RepID=UPI0022C9EE91|nr:hypothetical protein [Flavobacterium sp.]MCZ8090924.1 hypothetical protein [Flavobacterium sp.]MCZ8332425.1 hypothetical protein [Flavobacterium sp.]
MKLNKIIVIVSFVISNINSVFATGQIPDYLIIEKDTLSLHCNPLENYFQKNPIPNDLIKVTSSALWRGYIAYFKIVDNKLIVENIYKQDIQNPEKGVFKEELISIYKDIFGDKPNFECDFDGVLICPKGKQISYVHMGYSSTYEKYLLIEIKNGNYIREKEFSDEEYTNLKLKHFKKYQQSEEYKKALNETIAMFKETEKNLEKDFKEIKRENDKRKKQNKYLYEKEKELEYLQSAENFLFFVTTNNIKTIDIPN